jgi:hypothetical protein
LAKLGLQASTGTIRKYRPRARRQPSQSWRTFLQNHAAAIAAVDFFVVPTVTARLLYVLVVMKHARRKIVHFNITDAPTAAWTAQQIINAFPYDTAPEYLLRDRDSIYGSLFVRRVEGIKQKLISPRSPWQSPFHPSAHDLVGRLPPQAQQLARLADAGTGQQHIQHEALKEQSKTPLGLRPRQLIHDIPLRRWRGK